MARPNASSRLDPPTRRRAQAAAAKAARIHARIQRRKERHDEAVARLEAERAAAWQEATELGMSRTEVAKAAGLHHSAVDRALN